MNKKKLNSIILAALFAALVTISTMIIQIPTIVKGYIHLGDTIVYLSGILLGPLYGALAAGLGSFLADMLSGFVVFSIPTLIIKGVEAMVVGFIFKQVVLNAIDLKQLLTRYILAVVAGGSIMVGGYFLAEIFLFGFEVAVLEIVPNIVQAVGGGIIGFPLLLALKRSNVFDNIL